MTNDLTTAIQAAMEAAVSGADDAHLPDPEGEVDAAVLSGTEQVLVDGESLLDQVREFLATYIWLGDDVERLDTIALWVVHTWSLDYFTTTPRLCLFSGDEGSGKTLVLDVLGVLCHKPVSMAATTFNAFKRILAEHPTILFDEVDNYFNDDPNNELLKLLNAGYKISGKWLICVGPNHTVTSMSAFAPVAMAGLDNQMMPNTLKSRSIVVRLKKKRLTEHVQPLFEEDAAEDAVPLLADIRTWVAANGDALRVTRATRPEMPEGVGNREAEIWWPLVSIGRAAGERWHAKALAACWYFASRREDEKDSPNLQFMRDVREVFSHHDDPRGLQSTTLVAGLLALPRGVYFTAADGRQPIDASWLAKRMRACSIEKQKKRWMPGGSPNWGYTLADVIDWMDRHIKPDDDEEPYDDDPTDTNEPQAWSDLVQHANLRGTL